MAHDVGERFLDDPEACRLELGWQALLDRIGLEFRGDAGPLGLALHERPQRRDQAQVVERRRAEIEGQIAGLLDRAVDDGARVLDQRAQRSRIARFLDGPEVQADGDQRLAELVVQLAGDPAALGFLRRDQPLGEQRALLARSGPPRQPPRRRWRSRWLPAPRCSPRARRGALGSRP
jgi:hypothetical protein